ncbi:hypothetical protein CKO28_22260 [Rhodovibrio sodomensis]|uniref:Tyr recombinase domain-containing protein n=2 Tax=Rhodovibrio sodomensis TaxID=1088 RepID=A0ABS1DL62_9PROT|nr:hypothetical protein [Rhodovibrio sodomensis]
MVGEAAARGARLRVITDLAFQELERAVSTGLTISDQTFDQLVQQLIRDELDRCERERELAGPRTEADIQQAVLDQQRQRARLQQALRTNVYGDLEDQLAPAIEAVQEVATEPDLAVLRRRAARGLMDATEINEAREQGIYSRDTRVSAVAANGSSLSAPVSGPLDGARLPMRREPAQPSQSAAPAPAKTPAVNNHNVLNLKRDRSSTTETRASESRGSPTHRSVDGRTPGAGPRISDVKEMFIAEQRKSMRRHCRVAVDLLQDGLDDLVISEMSRAAVADVIVLITQLPVTHGKSSKTKLRLREQVARTNAEETEAIEAAVQCVQENGADRKKIARASLEARIERLSSIQSLTNHRRRINSFLRWCHKKGYIPQAFQVDLEDIPRQVRDDAENRDQKKGARMSWGREKLQKLLTSSIMTDPNKELGDPMFWSILAGPHQAPRMEEWMQIDPQTDVGVEEGIPVIRIQRGLGQHAKTEAAERVLPIHPVLIAAGFLDLVEQRRAEGSHWLFPMLDHGADGRFSSIFTKRFSRYREDEGLYDPQHDYHSLRSDFQEFLDDADVPLNVRKRLMGHRIEDITEGKYRKRDYSISRKAEYIKLIDYGIEVERINGIPVVKLRDRADASEPTAADEVVL